MNNHFSFEIFKREGNPTEPNRLFVKTAEGSIQLTGNDQFICEAVKDLINAKGYFFNILQKQLEGILPVEFEAEINKQYEKIGLPPTFKIPSYVENINPNNPTLTAAEKEKFPHIFGKEPNWNLGIDPAANEPPVLFNIEEKLRKIRTREFEEMEKLAVFLKENFRQDISENIKGAKKDIPEFVIDLLSELTERRAKPLGVPFLEKIRLEDAFIGEIVFWLANFTGENFLNFGQVTGVARYITEVKNLLSPEQKVESYQSGAVPECFVLRSKPALPRAIEAKKLFRRVNLTNYGSQSAESFNKNGLLEYFQQFLGGDVGPARAEVLADICLLVQSETEKRIEKQFEPIETEFWGLKLPSDIKAFFENLEKAELQQMQSAINCELGERFGINPNEILPSPSEEKVRQLNEIESWVFANLEKEIQSLPLANLKKVSEGVIEILRHLKKKADDFQLIKNHLQFEFTNELNSLNLGSFENAGAIIALLNLLREQINGGETFVNDMDKLAKFIFATFSEDLAKGFDSPPTLANAIYFLLAAKAADSIFGKVELSASSERILAENKFPNDSQIEEANVQKVLEQTPTFEEIQANKPEAIAKIEEALFEEEPLSNAVGEAIAGAEQREATRLSNEQFGEDCQAILKILPEFGGFTIGQLESLLNFPVGRLDYALNYMQTGAMSETGNFENFFFTRLENGYWRKESHEQRGLRYQRIYFKRGFLDATNEEDAFQSVGVSIVNFEIVDKSELIYARDLPNYQMQGEQQIIFGVKNREDLIEAFQNAGWEIAE